MTKKLLITLLLCSTAFATVTGTDTDNIYTGDDATVAFAFNFGIFSTSEVVVDLITTATGVPVTKAITTHYTVSAPNNNYWTGPGGTVTMITAPALTEKLYIRRVPPLTQEFNLSAKSTFQTVSTKTFENVLDKIVTMIQYVNYKTGLSISIPANESGLTVELPNAVDRANEFISFDASGNVQTSDGSSALIPGTLIDGGVLLGSGTGEVTAMAVLGDGEMIVGDGTTDPVAESGATLRTSIGVGTGDSPQFAGLNLGHATATTLTGSAGVLSVEGSIVPAGAPTDGYNFVGDGSAWQIQSKVFLDIRDYGAIPNDDLDDTAAFVAAMAAAPIGSTILVPQGQWLVTDLAITKLGLTFKGVGMSTVAASGTGTTSGGTIIQCGTTASVIFIFSGADVTWSKQLVIEDIGFKAFGTWAFATKDGTAIKLGASAADTSTGRIVLERVSFTGFEKAVEKVAGNIGNTFNNCVWQTNAYCMYADGVPVMHAGSDYYTKCHMAGSTKAVFYYDSDSSSADVVIRDCIVEANPGFVFFVPNFHTGIEQGIKVIDTYFESNSNYGADDVTIGAITYTVAGTGDGSIVFAQLTNCPSMIFTNCYVSEFNIKTDNFTYPTSVYLNHCSYDASYLLTSDAHSIFVADELNIGFTPPTIGNPSKIDYSKAGEILLTETFSEVVTFTTGGDQATTSSVDGTLFSTSQNHSQAAQYKTYGSVSISAGSWVFSQATLKKISGLTCAVQVRNPAGTFSTTLVGTLPDEWTTYSSIVYEADAEITVGLYVAAPASGTTVIRFGGLQILEFATRQEAEEFRLSGAFAMDPTATNFYKVPGDVNMVGDLTVLGDDIFATTNTTGYIWRADGTNYNPVSFVQSSDLAGMMSDETGTGALVLANTPTLITPVLGAATGTSVDLGTTTLLESRALTVDTGGVFNVSIGAASGDDFTVDATKFVVEGDTGNIGFGTATPRATGGIELAHASQPIIILNESGAAADTKLWDINTSSGTLSMRLLNDAIGAATNWIQVSRTAMTVNSVIFPNGTVTVRGITKLGSDTDNQSVGATGIRTFNGAAYDTNIQLGHAADTTLARSAAGIMTVEGNEVPVWVGVPATAGAAGVAGQMAKASGTLYICIATNTWEKVTIATW